MTLEPTLSGEVFIVSQMRIGGPDGMTLGEIQDKLKDLDHTERAAIGHGFKALNTRIEYLEDLVRDLVERVEKLENE